MAKKNDDFFKEKTVWAEVKDELLGCYLKPYVQKILKTYRPLIYVDCFAGKGKFDDGKLGSPLIALDIIDECLKKTKTLELPETHSYFIELNHEKELEQNLKNYSNFKVIKGKYEEEIEKLLYGKDNCNVFLYIDPYGIKSLQHSFLHKFSLRKSIELLINMNSFGFIRAACQAMKVDYLSSDDDDLVEYDSTEMSASDKSIAKLDKIAGGDYWQSIIKDYNQKKDGYVAENLFATQYCNQLRKSYQYVLNIPIRIKKGHRPKYRLIYATNHPDGCLLMVKNMCERLEALQKIQSSGQGSLFEENCENEIVNSEDIKTKSINFFSQFKDLISLHESLAKFFMEHGIICSPKIVKDMIATLEKENLIELQRDPVKTPTGKISAFMDEKGKQKILIRWKK